MRSITVKCIKQKLRVEQSYFHFYSIVHLNYYRNMVAVTSHESLKNASCKRQVNVRVGISKLYEKIILETKETVINYVYSKEISVELQFVITFRAKDNVQWGGEAQDDYWWVPVTFWFYVLYCVFSQKCDEMLFVSAIIVIL